MRVNILVNEKYAVKCEEMNFLNKNFVVECE